MNYGRIQRGPMAADAHFTQISNTLFRDNRLSFRDKGVFGLISTHREGFGVTAESIAACSPTDGVTSVKTSLRNLETYGYLKRTRVRRPDGTLGGAVYFITDDPQMNPGAQNGAQGLETPSSEPTVAQPPLAEPTQVEPTLAGPALVGPTLAELLHKNTNSKHTKLEEDSLSSDAPVPNAPEPPAPDERETMASPKGPTAAQRVLRSGGLVSAAEEQAFIVWATAKFNIQGPGWWRTSAPDLPEHVEAWRASLISRSRGPSLPPWCGSCADGWTAAQLNVRLRMVDVLGERVPCPDCHPDAATAA